MCVWCGWLARPYVALCGQPVTDSPSMCTQRPAAVNIHTLMLAAVSPAPPPECELRLLINVLHRHRCRCVEMETRERVTYRCEDDDDRVSLCLLGQTGRGSDPWNRLERKCPPEFNVSPVDRLWWPRLLLLHLTALAASCWRRISRHGVSMDSHIDRTPRRVCRLVAQLDAVERLSEPATSFDLHRTQDPNDTWENSWSME